MIASILNSTKKNLGISEDYDVWDETLIMHINSVFSTLCQLGIGSSSGFMIEDDSKVWADFLEDDRLNSVRTYMFLRVKLLFDPPDTGYLTEALKEQVKELEWRMNVVREDDQWVDPSVVEIPEDVILDGGGG